MAEAFKVHVSDGNPMVIRFSGAINEYADVDLVKVKPENAIEIDMSGVTAINSTGLRVFRNWSQALTNERIEISYCPKVFVDQLNMILSLVPDRVRVTSFYVPYSSEASGEEKYVLYVANEHYSKKDGQIVFNHPAVADAAGVPMAMDVLPRYFSFLSRHF